MKKKKKVVKLDKPEILKQSYIYNKDWKDIYQLEDRIINIITKTYSGKVMIRYEIYDLISIQIQFKILSKVYECMISKRENNYGFSIYNINDPHKFSDISLNKTIENDKF